METLSLEDKLFLDGFRPDEESHLVIIDPKSCATCERKPCTYICPSKCYRWEQEQLTVFYEGCLECGSCRISCPHTNIEWRYPRGGFGVSFKFG